VRICTASRDEINHSTSLKDDDQDLRSPRDDPNRNSSSQNGQDWQARPSYSFSQGGFNRAAIEPNTPMPGFISSREALKILPPDPVRTITNAQKRKPTKQSANVGKKTYQPIQRMAPSLIKLEEQLPPFIETKKPPIKVVSSGIVQDRGLQNQPARLLMLQPLDQHSSPPRGVDLDFLPSVSFSSPSIDSVPSSTEKANRNLSNVASLPLAHRPPLVEKAAGPKDFAGGRAPRGRGATRRKYV
jgi:hypothetical protein